MIGWLILKFILLLLPSIESSVHMCSELNDEIYQGSSREWKLVWNDEFSYKGSPDPQKWGYDIGGDGWGNDELEYYTNRTQNSRVEGGNLIIEARKEDYEGRKYTSARLVTTNKGDWTYGRFYIRARLPILKGNGTWPAIWMLPTDWQGQNWPDVGELDIMEQVSYDPSVIHGSIHTHDYNWVNGTQKTATIDVDDADENFHVYALEWTEKSIKYFVDATHYFTFENNGEGWESWPFTHSFHLILNIAVGGFWGGAFGVDDSIFPAQMLIDYVRVCQ